VPFALDSASYAAVPHLLRIAKLPAFRFRFDPLLLIASIELARLEHRGPLIPEDLEPDYRAAVTEARATRTPVRIGCQAPNPNVIGHRTQS